MNVIRPVWRLSLAILALVSVSMGFNDRGAKTTYASGQSSLPAQESTSQSSEPLAPGIALGIYRAHFPVDLSVADSYEQESGRRLSIIHWYALWGGWKSEFSVDDLRAVASRGSMPMITWEPWSGLPSDPNWSLRDAILSGRHDDYIRSWAQGMARYGDPVLLRFAQEMHDSDFPWAVDVSGNTTYEYVAAWRRIHGIFAEEGATNVKWIWNPNTIGDTPGSVYEPLYRELFPGDDQIDFIGLDIYDTGPYIDWGAPYHRTLAEILREPYAVLTEISTRPVILAEVGTATTHQDRAAWVEEGLGESLPAAFPRVRAVVWFDVNKELWWEIRTSETGRSAFLSTWRQPHFGLDHHLLLLP